MLRKLAATLAAVALTVGLAVTLSLISPLRRPPAETVELVRATKLACATAGRVLGLGEGEVVSAPLDAGDATSGTGQVDAAAQGPSTLSAAALLVGGVLAEQPTRSWTRCETPSPEGMLLVSDPGSTELVVVNSDANEAVIDLALLGADGEIAAVGARGIAVAPGVSRTVALSVLAPDGPVGVVYTASQGRVAVVARPVEGRNGATVGSAAAQTSQTVAGIPAGATSTTLLLSNPSEDRVEVGVEALGASSAYEPAPAAGISLAPRSTQRIDLGTSLGGEASALRVTSSVAIGAAVQVSGADAVASSLVAGVPGERLGALVPQAEAVQVTNPGTAPAKVELTVGEAPVEVEVAAGTTTAVNVTAAGLTALRVEADVPVLASALSGGSVIPLDIVVEDESSAGVVVLDPSLR